MDSFQTPFRTIGRKASIKNTQKKILAGSHTELRAQRRLCVQLIRIELVNTLAAKNSLGKI